LSNFSPWCRPLRLLQPGQPRRPARPGWRVAVSRRCAMGTRWWLLGTAIGLCSLSAGADDWPQFRGPTRDNKVTGFKAPQAWPTALKQQWKVSVGDGVASPVLAGDRVYTFTRQGSEEVVLCLD